MIFLYTRTNLFKLGWSQSRSSSNRVKYKHVSYSIAKMPGYLFNFDKSISFSKKNRYKSVSSRKYG